MDEGGKKKSARAIRRRSFGINIRPGNFQACHKREMFASFLCRQRGCGSARAKCLTQRLSQRELQLLSVTFQGASSSYQPMQLNSVPTEFECDNFIGRLRQFCLPGELHSVPTGQLCRCMLLHRPEVCSLVGFQQCQKLAQGFP